MLKKKKTPKAQSNGDNLADILAIVKTIANKQTELDERITEVEDGRGREQAQLRLVNLLYDTDDKHLPGLTRLPLTAVKPFAVAMMLDALRSEEVKSGKVSLPSVFRTSYFHLMRSVGAEALNKGNELAAEQASGEAEKGAEYNLGQD
jgi:hypothetical protein